MSSHAAVPAPGSLPSSSRQARPKQLPTAQKKSSKGHPNRLLSSNIPVPAMKSVQSGASSQRTSSAKKVEAQTGDQGRRKANLCGTHSGVVGEYMGHLKAQKRFSSRNKAKPPTEESVKSGSSSDAFEVGKPVAAVPAVDEGHPQEELGEMELHPPAEPPAPEAVRHISTASQICSPFYIPPPSSRLGVRPPGPEVHWRIPSSYRYPVPPKPSQTLYVKEDTAVRLYGLPNLTLTADHHYLLTPFAFVPSVKNGGTMDNVSAGNAKDVARRRYLPSEPPENEAQAGVRPPSKNRNLASDSQPKERGSGEYPGSSAPGFAVPYRGKTDPSSPLAGSCTTLMASCGDLLSTTLTPGEVDARQRASSKAADPLDLHGATGLEPYIALGSEDARKYTSGSFRGSSPSEERSSPVWRPTRSGTGGQQAVRTREGKVQDARQAQPTSELLKWRFLTADAIRLSGSRGGSGKRRGSRVKQQEETVASRCGAPIETDGRLPPQRLNEVRNMEGSSSSTSPPPVHEASAYGSPHSARGVVLLHPHASNGTEPRWSCLNAVDTQNGKEVYSLDPSQRAVEDPSLTTSQDASSAPASHGKSVSSSPSKSSPTMLPGSSREGTNFLTAVQRVPHDVLLALDQAHRLMTPDGRIKPPKRKNDSMFTSLFNDGIEDLSVEKAKQELAASPDVHPTNLAVDAIPLRVLLSSIPGINGRPPSSEEAKLLHFDRVKHERTTAESEALETLRQKIVTEDTEAPLPSAAETVCTRTLHETDQHHLPSEKEMDFLWTEFKIQPGPLMAPQELVERVAAPHPNVLLLQPPSAVEEVPFSATESARLDAQKPQLTRMEYETKKQPFLIAQSVFPNVNGRHLDMLAIEEAKKKREKQLIELFQDYYPEEEPTNSQPLTEVIVSPPEEGGKPAKTFRIPADFPLSFRQFLESQYLAVEAGSSGQRCSADSPRTGRVSTASPHRQSESSRAPDRPPQSPLFGATSPHSRPATDAGARRARQLRVFSVFEPRQIPNHPLHRFRAALRAPECEVDKYYEYFAPPSGQVCHSPKKSIGMTTSSRSAPILANTTVLEPSPPASASLPPPTSPGTRHLKHLSQMFLDLLNEASELHHYAAEDRQRMVEIHNAFQEQRMQQEYQNRHPLVDVTESLPYDERRRSEVRLKREEKYRKLRALAAQVELSSLENPPTHTSSTASTCRSSSTSNRQVDPVTVPSIVQPEFPPLSARIPEVVADEDSSRCSASNSALLAGRNEELFRQLQVDAKVPGTVRLEKDSSLLPDQTASTEEPGHHMLSINTPRMGELGEGAPVDGYLNPPESTKTVVAVVGAGKTRNSVSFVELQGSAVANHGASFPSNSNTPVPESSKSNTDGLAESSNPGGVTCSQADGNETISAPSSSFPQASVSAPSQTNFQDSMANDEEETVKSLAEAEDSQNEEL